MSQSEVLLLDILHPEDYQRNTLSSKNVNELAYTLLAGSALCMRLKIQQSAYRLLKTPNNPDICTLVLIQKEVSLPSNQIKGPYSLVACFGNQITLNRLNLGVASINNQLLPLIPQAAQLFLYTHPQSIYSELTKSIISTSSFVVSTKRQQIYVDFGWLKDKQFTKGYGEMFVSCRKLMAQNAKKKFTNYLKINMKAIPQNQNQAKCGMCIFAPNKTKIVFQKAFHYDLNQITKRINLPRLYQIEYLISSYKKLHKQMFNIIEEKPEKKIILLKTLEGFGISSYLHKLSQDNQYDFVKINCEYFVSQKQLIEKISKSDSNKSTVLMIKNIQWLLQVGNDKNDSTEKMKRIVRALEDAFTNLAKQTLTSHILIVCFKGSQIKLDMIKNASLIYFQMSKQERKQSLQIVAKYYQKQTSQICLAQPEDVLNLAANSLGWVTFSKVLKRLKQKNRESLKSDKLQTDEVLKQIGKLVSMQKVENIKNVTWDDVGGLQAAKQQIIQTILLPTKHPEIFDEWIKPRTGLLFYGPPGTGKTLLGKCIANQCKMGFISVKGPELLNMYIGESQKNVRDVFQRAAASKPCIVFMDELDALIPKRGQSSDSNQVMDRIVSELLTQMDKAPSQGIFIIGATNRPDLLDPSILRPGRFDKQIYIGITTEKQSRIQILKAQTRHIKLREGFNYGKVIDNVPNNFTGADFYGLTSRSITKAAQRFIQEYQRKQKNQTDEVVINQQDFIETAKQMKPSVSLQQLSHYEKLRQQYK